MTVYYTQDHEWISVEGKRGTVGITDHAQEQLGDVVFVELPEIDAVLSKGDEAAVVESVKAASEVYAPVSGTVVKRNDALVEEPGMVNDSPTDDGWFYVLELSDPGELDTLMDESTYEEFVKEQG